MRNCVTRDVRPTCDGRGLEQSQRLVMAAVGALPAALATGRAAPFRGRLWPRMDEFEGNFAFIACTIIAFGTGFVLVLALLSPEHTNYWLDRAKRPDSDIAHAALQYGHERAAPQH